MKFNILLTTYEILLKDKVSSLFSLSYHIFIYLIVCSHLFLFIKGAISCKTVQYPITYKIWINVCVYSHFWATLTGPSLALMRHID